MWVGDFDSGLPGLLPLLVALVLDFLEAFGGPFLFLFFVLLLFLDLLFEFLKPLLVVVQDGQDPLFGFVLVVLLDWDEAELLTREDAAAEVSRLGKSHFFFEMEGFSLGLEQSSTPL